MKARLIWLPLLAGIVVILAGCPGLFGGPGDGGGDEDPGDTTSPTEVTELAAARSSGTAALVWTDPTDEDLAGVQVTWEPGGTDPQEVGLGVGEYVATGLTNGTEYTFTVAAVDEAGNVSAGETIAVTPEDFSAISGTVGTMVEFQGSAVVQNDPSGFAVSAQGISGTSWAINTDSDGNPSGSNVFDLDLSTPPADSLWTADQFSGLSFSDTDAGIQTADIHGSFESAWVYGSDYIYYGTRSSSSWTFVQYMYADRMVHVTGTFTDAAGHDQAVDVLLAPGWNRVLVTYDIASTSYNVENANPPSGSDWYIEQNPLRAAAAVDVAFEGADADWTPRGSFLPWDGQDLSVAFLQGIVDEDLTFDRASTGAYSDRRVALRIDFTNGDGSVALKEDTYSLGGNDGTDLDAVTAYVFSTTGDISTQELMISESLPDGASLFGTEYQISGGDISITLDPANVSWNLTTDPADDGPITGTWEEPAPPLDSATFYSGDGTIMLPDNTTVSLTGAAFQGSYDSGADVNIYGVVLYGEDLTASADGLTGTGPLVWIDLDEFSGHSDEPRSASYEFGGASDVTETRGSFVEFGVIDETTLSDYAGGDEPFAGAGSGAAYAYHIFDADPGYDNINPTTLTAGFTEVDAQRGPSVGSTLDIGVSQDNGDAWDLSFTFGTQAGN